MNCLINMKNHIGGHISVRNFFFGYRKKKAEYFLNFCDRIHSLNSASNLEYDFQHPLDFSNHILFCTGIAYLQKDYQLLWWENAQWNGQYKASPSGTVLQITHNRKQMCYSVQSTYFPSFKVFKVTKGIVCNHYHRINS